MLKFFTPAFLLIASYSIAQNTGIGNTTPTNKLHVTAATDPLRLEGLQSGTATDSLLTVNSTGVVKRRNFSSLTGAWSILGNTGTTTTANFVGTIDKIPLIFRTNNLRSGYIDPNELKRNNSFGQLAVNPVVTGEGNNAFGFYALGRVTTGNNNTILGDSSANNITTGADNVSVGTDALFSAVTATGNVAIGSNALRNSVSSENVAVGFQAALGNQVGNNILAIGTNSLLSNVTTNTELAIGNNALALLTAGGENIAIGYNAGTSLATASSNVLVGNFALSAAITSSNNTVVGHNAGLAFLGTGNNNHTFIGYQAGFTLTAGTGNTFIGSAVDVPTTSTNISNSTGLGQGAVITASNQVRVGNTSVTSIGGQVGWTAFSDERIKKEIRSDVPGLDFIMLLKPVTYYYDVQKQLALQGVKNTNMQPQAPLVRHTGFLAQEVEKAANLLQYDFDGVDKPQNENTPYGLRYATFVVPLVKAMQEMKALIDEQKVEIERLRKLVENK
jgi:trimeric autotransporter adhesin